MKITIKYFASFREESCMDEEVLFLKETTTLKELYARLRKKHAFALNLNEVRLAVNESYQKESYVCQDEDVVVFIPPIAGG